MLQAVYVLSSALYTTTSSFFLFFFIPCFLSYISLFGAPFTATLLKPGAYPETDLLILER